MPTGTRSGLSSGCWRWNSHSHTFSLWTGRTCHDHFHKTCSVYRAGPPCCPHCLHGGPPRCLHCLHSGSPGCPTAVLIEDLLAVLTVLPPVLPDVLMVVLQAVLTAVLMAVLPAVLTTVCPPGGYVLTVHVAVKLLWGQDS